MKKLYYTVEKHTYDDGEPNGLRTLKVYGEDLRVFAELECMSDDLGEYLRTNEEEIQEYLDDNGYSDEEFEFIKL